MKKRNLLIIILLMTLLFAACKPKTSNEDMPDPLNQEATQAPGEANKAPTHTPRYLGPIYQTKIFLGGQGWANNVDKTAFYRTTNFGEHWVTATPPDLAQQIRDYPMISSFFTSGRTGYILLNRPEEKSLLYRTGDGGESWETIELDFPGGQMYFISSTEGYILSSLGLAAGSEYVALNKTIDGGKTWQTVFSHETGQSSDIMPHSGSKNGISFLDANVGFITGFEPVVENLYLYRTADGGQSWEKKSCENLPVFGEADMWEPSPVRRINTTTAYLAIKASIAERDTTVTHWCKTEDAGDSWQYVSSRDQIEFSDFGSPTFGIAYGNGKMLRTIDAGLTWEDYSPNTCPGMVPVSVQVVSDVLAYMVCSSNAPGDLEALNQNRLFVSMSNARLWQTVEAAIIK
jgi:photosystem II stability/assembly factor-like uncharacterized protein